MEERELNHQAVLNLLPNRDPWAHKGKFGKLLLLCGREGYTGAAALATMGALRSGAGLVYLGVPRCIYAIEAVKLTEAVVFPLPCKDGGFSSSAATEIRKRLPDMDAVLIGPGMGQSEGTLDVLATVLEEYTGTVVVDADGINLLSQHKYLLRGRTGVTIVTPHDGEFVRLAGSLSADRANDAAALHSCFHKSDLQQPQQSRCTRL